MVKIVWKLIAIIIDKWSALPMIRDITYSHKHITENVCPFIGVAQGKGNSNGQAHLLRWPKEKATVMGKPIHWGDPRKRQPQ